MWTVRGWQCQLLILCLFDEFVCVLQFVCVCVFMIHVCVCVCVVHACASVYMCVCVCVCVCMCVRAYKNMYIFCVCERDSVITIFDCTTRCLPAITKHVWPKKAVLSLLGKADQNKNFKNDTVSQCSVGFVFNWQSCLHHWWLVESRKEKKKKIIVVDYFMALHLVRVWGVYKDIRIHSSHTHTCTHTKTHTQACTHTCTHTHTHKTCINTHTHYNYMHYWWWVGRKKKKMTDQYAEEKGWGLGFLQQVTAGLTATCSIWGLVPQVTQVCNMKQQQQKCVCVWGGGGGGARKAVRKNMNFFLGVFRCILITGLDLHTCTPRRWGTWVCCEKFVWKDASAFAPCKRLAVDCRASDEDTRCWKAGDWTSQRMYHHWSVIEKTVLIHEV